MAEVTVTAVVNLRVTDKEWRLIMKSLAAFAGVQIKPAKGERVEAEALNRSLLGQRRGDLRDQLAQADAALQRAEEARTNAAFALMVDDPTLDDVAYEVKDGEDQV
jgi:hypothetical protein